MKSGCGLVEVLTTAAVLAVVAVDVVQATNPKTPDVNVTELAVSGFNWTKDGDTLKGFERVYKGLKDHHDTEDLSEAVDVSFHIGSDVVPPEFPTEFIFQKVMDAFDTINPGYDDYEPTQVVPVEHNQFITGDLQDDAAALAAASANATNTDTTTPAVRRGRRRYLRSGGSRSTTTTADMYQVIDRDAATNAAAEHRDLKKVKKLTVCPSCKKAHKWKTCLKNKCKSKKKKRRILTAAATTYEEHQQVQRMLSSDSGSGSGDGSGDSTPAPAPPSSDPAPTPAPAANTTTPEGYGWRTGNWKWTGKTSKYRNGGSGSGSDDGEWTNYRDKTQSRYEETAEKVTAVAMTAAEELELAANQTLTKALEFEAAGDLELAAVYRAKAALEKEAAALFKEKGNDVETIADLGTENLELTDTVILYEEQWAEAASMLDVGLEEIKCAGKMEDALNKVIEWFSTNYNVSMGIVVNNLAAPSINDSKDIP